ncbi:MAG: PSD1 and planctomycete cytochrome C domain-containing protein [Chthoniobacter sp.]|nr:PSD1 and planctomycete cytochrome C domain-containing protein [Chthoniobacter sp.]
MKPLLTFLTALLCGGSAFAALGEEKKAENPAITLTPEQRDFFEKKIRPVLADKCYKCHSEKSEKIKGGLTLDTREGLRRGGENGPAVVPGDLKESLLIEAVRYANKDFAMPPQKSGGKLADEVIRDFEKWVQMGAPDPRDGVAKVVKKHDTEKAREWWAFQPVKKPAVPAVKGTAWPKSDLDRFVLAGLEAKGLKPVADADKLTLIRRVYFDLTGLPPALPEITAFVQDKSPEAFAKVVDRLLASPQFGERWGRHWLDVARYAESSGKDANIAFPHAWRYRDYVITAFNADKPYDQFLREQIAGDLLPAKDDRERAEHQIATGYLAIGAKSLNEQNPRQFALDVADEQIDAISQGVLGMTIACARCHDHKFDPIPQRDYYAMAGIFLSTDTRYGTAAGLQNRHPTKPIELPAGAGLPKLAVTLPAEERARKETQLAALKTERDDLVAERLKARRAGTQDTAQNGARALRLIAQVGELEAELAAFDTSGQLKALAMGVVDRPAAGTAAGFGGTLREGIRSQIFGRASAFGTITDSPVFARGEPDKPGQKVPRGFIAALSPGAAPAIPAQTSGRRELAEWMVASENPLTARVMANRVWHWLFGRGLVESVDNFGTTGQPPANPALLDHLALRLRDGGWSVKKLIREIVLSRSYQLGSGFDEKSFAADPENALVWRMSKRRLDAECIRDAILATSQQLQLQPPVGSPIARAGEGPVSRPRRIGADELVNASTNVRSVYLPIVRDLLPDSLAVFDFAEPSLVTGARETTNVPSQALFLLNSPFVATQAKLLGERIVASYPGGPNGGAAANLDERLTYAYWLVCGRPPDAVERTAAMSFFGKFPAAWSKGDTSTLGLRNAEAATAAWTSFCRALFASAEFRYLN